MARERHKKYLPELVTLKLAEGLPSLRQTEEWVVMRGVFESMKALEDFRITHFSLMSNHVHMIVEADSHEAFTRGMRSFVSRMSKRLVALWGRTGQGLRVLKERYHARRLSAPREVWNAIRYVLNNFRRHGFDLRGEVVDIYSSGRWAIEWDATITGRPRGPSPISNPRTWLLNVGWRDCGLIDIYARPA